ncbi:transmembrane amino acid transporter protein-domain-containing protein [Absidia repens]|uniref:Transmembrane amino acid transporter protein-domain-containing protein n=1 Tax=Absidia repens TaxID=90262 RepID=A0A1X2IBU5_9FUNG|nr:transmembrane amino acid transporter protein-domain-containing protein [Absidia repens]
MTLNEFQNSNVEEQGMLSTVMPHADLDLYQSTQLGYGTRNVVEVALNIVNAAVGAGVIGLPFALVLAGFTPGLLLSILVAMLMTGAIYSMIVCGQKVGVYSFAGLAEHTMGQFGFYMLNLMLFIQSAGSCVSYFILVADTLPVLLSMYLPQYPMLGERQLMTILISVFLIFPLNLFRSIGSLARWSAFSVFLLPIMVLTVLIRAPSYAGQNDTPLFSLGRDPVAATGIMSFAFVCSQVAFSNYLSQRNQSLSTWLQSSALSTTISWTISISFAVVGYLSFGVNADANIFSNFPVDDHVINVGRLALGISMILTVPMAFFPARDAMQKALGIETAEKQPSNLQHYSLTVILFTIFLTLGVCLHSLGKVYSVVGGIASSFLAYIIPGYAYLKIFRPFPLSSTSGNADELIAFAKTQPTTMAQQNDDPSKESSSTSSCLLSVCATLLVLFGSMVMFMTTFGAFR